MSSRWLVLIETGGNQHYIFATNKLRENVGASGLVRAVGEDWLWAAVDEVLGQDAGPAQTAYQTGALVGDTNGSWAELLLATSGKALVLVDSQKTGQAIVRTVTGRALDKAAGLAVDGVVLECPDGQLAATVVKAHRTLSEVTARRPGPETRFPRLPFVAECATSGRPAAILETVTADVREVTAPHPRQPADSRPVRTILQSRQTADKEEARTRAITHLVNLCGEGTVLSSGRELEDEWHHDWLALIHADGNGLGKLFLKFEEVVEANKEPGESDDAAYIRLSREFSQALNDCTVEALREALKQLEARGAADRKGRLPVVPLVVGGDDLTVLVEGKYGVQFAHDYLEAFAQRATDSEFKGGLLKKIGKHADGKRLSACAGVALVKRTYPLHAAYDLAEELLRHAKGIKAPLPGHSALSFRALFESGIPKLERILDDLTVPDGASTCRLYGGPYLVGDVQPDYAPEPEAQYCHWDTLADQVERFRRQDNDGRRSFSNSQAHALREALHRGPAAGDALFDQLRGRYGGLAEMVGAGDSLFYPNRDGRRATRYLDALDLSGFWSSPSPEEPASAAAGEGGEA